MASRKSGFEMPKFDTHIDTALVVIFTLIRGVWLYSVYSSGVYQLVQMNNAFNIMDGRGIVIGPVPGDTGVYTPYDWNDIWLNGNRLSIAPMLGNVGVYTPYNWFPPGISFLLIPFYLLTGDIFLSEFLL
jgi:hypothetical protein